MPKVSIITAAYNADKYIRLTYDSIRAQSFTDWEWVVCNDCSTDQTQAALEDIARQDERVRLYSTPSNSGAAQARNLSLRAADGEFIAFLDADDIWQKDKLQKQLSFMENGAHVFSFTAYNLVDARGDLLNQVVDASQRNFQFTYNDMLKKSATLGCSTVMLRRAYFSDLQMPDYRTGQDYALWLKLLKEAPSAVLLPEPLSSYRILPNSISRNKFKKAKRQWQLYRELERLPLAYSIWCFMHYAIRAVWRR